MNGSSSVASKAQITTGMVTVGVAGLDIAGGIAVNPNGSIWLAAYSRLGLGGEEDPGFTANLVKLNANGFVDTRFSSDGKAFLPSVAIDLESGRTAAAQEGGRYLASDSILVDGRYLAAVTRSNPDGTLDSSFGNGGVASLPFSGGEQQSVVVQSDGSILAGAVYDSGEVFIAHLNADGSLNKAFGDAGVLQIPASAGIYSGRAVEASLQDDGKVLITGSTFSYDDYTWQQSITRLNADGTPDGTFGADGTVIYSGRSDGLAVLDDGKILVAGSFEDGAILMRLNADGSLDTDFGGEGSLSPGYAGQGIDVADMKVLANGKILLAGSIGTSDDGTVLALMQLNADGSADTAFGNPEDGYQHLNGSALDDLLVGTASFNDAIAGGAGSDLIDGQQGRDLLTGDNGADVFRFQAVTDSYRTTDRTFSDRILDFDPGSDTLDLATLGFTGLGDGYDGTLAVRVNAEGTRTYLKSFDADANGQRFEVVLDGDLSQRLVKDNILFNRAQINGTDEADRLIGTARAEVISGLAGADYLTGGLGDDVLAGGAGRDRLEGDAGRDVFRFDALTDSYRTATGNFADRILDYWALDDTIDVSALGFSGFGNGHDGTLQVMTNEAHTLTYLKNYEADTSGKRFEVTLQGDHSEGGDLRVVFAGQPDEEEMQLLGGTQLDQAV